MSYNPTINISKIKRSNEQNYRSSVNIISNQKFRNTISYDFNSIPIIVSPTLYRTSFDLDSARMFCQNDYNLKQQNMNSYNSYNNYNSQKNIHTYSKLKLTLNELQLKLLNAKKQLCSHKNILDDLNELNEEEQEQQQSFQYQNNNNNNNKLNIKLYNNDNFCNNQVNFNTKNITNINNTTKASTQKICASQSTQIIQSLSQFSCPISFPFHKSYYLCQLPKAFSHQSQQLYQHLNISLKVIRSLPNFQSLSFIQIQDKKLKLTKQKNDKRKTLVIDLDQTIIHCEEEPHENYDLCLPIKLENNQYANAYITIRPYAISFLKKMSKYYEIIAFTASHSTYADIVLDEIDPERQFIQHRLYREHCIEIHPNIYTKDLRVINRDLSQMVLVDNAPYSYIFQLENGIPILPYYKGEDTQLPQLEKYLQELVNVKDVREVNKKRFKFHQYTQCKSVEEVLRQIYFKNHF